MKIGKMSFQQPQLLSWGSSGRLNVSFCLGKIPSGKTSQRMCAVTLLRLALVTIGSWIWFGIVGIEILVLKYPVILWLGYSLILSHAASSVWISGKTDRMAASLNVPVERRGFHGETGFPDLRVLGPSTPVVLLVPGDVHQQHSSPQEAVNIPNIHIRTYYTQPIFGRIPTGRRMHHDEPPSSPALSPKIMWWELSNRGSWASCISELFKKSWAIQ